MKNEKRIKEIKSELAGLDIQYDDLEDELFRLEGRVKLSFLEALKIAAELAPNQGCQYIVGDSEGCELWPHLPTDRQCYEVFPSGMVRFNAPTLEFGLFFADTSEGLRQEVDTLREQNVTIRRTLEIVGNELAKVRDRLAQ